MRRSCARPNRSQALIDDYRNGDYYDDDVEKMKTDFNKPMQYYIARRPQFMDFCERYGLVARWVHRENVGKLPFPDDEAGRALAASVGATVAELNAEPVEELAADVVFDALSQTGMVGFAEEEEVDRKRASFLTADGSFNHDVFGASLARSRIHSAAALSGVRVIPPAIILGVMYHHLPQLLEMAAAAQAQVKVCLRLPACEPRPLPRPTSLLIEPRNSSRLSVAAAQLGAASMVVLHPRSAHWRLHLPLAHIRPRRGASRPAADAQLPGEGHPRQG